MADPVSIRFADVELHAVLEAADRENTTRNVIVRVAVCRLLGLSLPRWAERMADQLEQKRGPRDRVSNPT